MFRYVGLLLFSPKYFFTQLNKFLQSKRLYHLFLRRRKQAADGRIYAVGIIRDEGPFLDEWLAYHRIIGVDHFILYDHDPALPLRESLKAHADYVTIIGWDGDHAETPGRNVQTKAYTHALGQLPPDCQWVTFIDVDEFIVLRRHESLHEFLSSLGQCGAVRLNWHVFGHNGYFDDPEGLVTISLTRRSAEPSIRTKAFSRPEAIDFIDSAHFCSLKPGWETVDANRKPFDEKLYPGKTDVAHINHYMCRSFTRWMNRVSRGDVGFSLETASKNERWKFDEQLCLRQFVMTIAKSANEKVDQYMLRYEGVINAYLKDLRQ